MPSPLLTLLAGRTRSPLLTGLVAYWKMDAASGNEPDVVGTRHLVDRNTVTSAAGKLNTARQFTAASSEYFDVAHDAGLAFTDKLSLSLWGYPDTLPALAELVNHWDYGVVVGWSVESNNTGDVSFSVSGPADPATGVAAGSAPAILAATTWSHIGIAYDGTQTGNANRLKIYHNGVAQTLSFTGTIPATLPVGSTPLNVGRFPSLGRHWNGRMDELGIWNLPLMAANFTTLYGGGTPPAHPFS